MKKGFTLIEMMTAVSIFAIVMTISMGSILSVINSNRKARSIRTVMSNLNIAVEAMSREMRYGKIYHCGTSLPLTTPLNCGGGATLMSFLSSDGQQMVYRQSPTSPIVEKSTDGGNTYTAVTAPEVIIDSLTFYTAGIGLGDGLQPKALIKLIGHSGTGSNRSDFTLQTLVSERTLEK